VLKPKCDEQLSNFAFKFNMRRYTEAQKLLRDRGAHLGSMARAQHSSTSHLNLSRLSH